jgi:hypothetical protein
VSEKKTDDGGPAFPSPLEWRERAPNGDETTGVYDNAHDGMTLRDYFAAKTLVGILQVPELRPASDEEIRHLAMRVYQVADAMLAERAKRGGS